MSGSTPCWFGKRNMPGDPCPVPDKFRLISVSKFSARLTGTACIVDSPPPSFKEQTLKGFLKSLGYEVDIQYHSSSQGSAECGYRAIICAHVLGAPEHFETSAERLKNLQGNTNHATKFCNSVIELERRSVAIWLSDESIIAIVQRMEFLYKNFSLHPWTFLDAHAMNELLLKLRNTLKSAIRIVPDSILWDSAVADVRRLLGMVSRKCKAENKHLIGKWAGLTYQTAADYRKIAEEYDAFIGSSSELPGWFDGVHSFSEFMDHMKNPPERTGGDQQLAPTKCAIVNTGERFAGEHWFVVAHTNVDYNQMLERYRKAT